MTDTQQVNGSIATVEESFDDDGNKVLTVNCDFEKLKRDLSDARLLFYSNFVFWSSYINCFKFAATLDPKIPLAATTPRGVIYINPLSWQHLNLKQKVFVIAHELGHHAFMTFERQNDRDMGIWNQATDYLINYILVEQMGEKCMIEGMLYEEKYGTWTAEEVYNEIYQKADQQGQGQGQGEGQGQEQGQGQGSQGGQGQELNGDMRESDPSDATVFEEGSEEYPKSQTEKQQKLSEAINQEKMQGNAPAGLVREAESHMSSKVDWRSRLRHLVGNWTTGPNKGDFSWLPPSRRFIHDGWFFPAPEQTTGPKIVIALDTSGSMSKDTLDQAMAEVEKIRDVTESLLYFLDCDATVYGGGWLYPQDSLPEIKGGGGTSFEPVFSYVDEEELDPDVLIFMTDTYGSFPKEHPNYPVLWVTESHVDELPFGEIVFIPR